MTDELIREVGRIRREVSSRCGHDPCKGVEYYRQFQDKLKQLKKYRFRDKSTNAEDETEDTGSKVTQQ